MKLRRKDKIGKILNVDTQLDGEIFVNDENELAAWICEEVGIESSNDNGKTWEIWMEKRIRTKIEKLEEEKFNEEWELVDSVLIVNR